VAPLANSRFLTELRPVRNDKGPERNDEGLEVGGWRPDTPGLLDSRGRLSLFELWWWRCLSCGGGDASGARGLELVPGDGIGTPASLAMSEERRETAFRCAGSADPWQRSRSRLHLLLRYKPGARHLEFRTPP